jgi:hypothetical protein
VSIRQFYTNKSWYLFSTPKKPILETSTQLQRASSLRRAPRSVSLSLPVRADRWAWRTSPTSPGTWRPGISSPAPSTSRLALLPLRTRGSDDVPSPASPPPHSLPRPPLLPRTHSWPQRLLDLAAARFRAGGAVAGSRRPARQARREASSEARVSGRPRSGAGARPTVH